MASNRITVAGDIVPIAKPEKCLRGMEHCHDADDRQRGQWNRAGLTTFVEAEHQRDARRWGST
ncbi:MAG: hypothetical protein ACREDL_01240 [Bradyrhizobium sp.]